MRFPWQRAHAPGIRPERAGEDPAPEGPRPQACPTLAKALEKALRLRRPEVLDLGPFCGASAVYLGGRGLRVSVDELEPPVVAPPQPARRSGEPRRTPQKAPLELRQPAAAYDLVLAWELIDFIPPDRLAELGAGLHRVMAEGGIALLFSQSSTSGPQTPSLRPPRYRILADDQVVVESVAGDPLPRFVHPTREIERAFAPLLLQGIHLQRSQMREVLLFKRPR